MIGSKSALKLGGNLEGIRRWLSVLLSQVNPEMKADFEKNGLQFAGQDVEGERMEIIELEGERQSVLRVYSTAFMILSGLSLEEDARHSLR